MSLDDDRPQRPVRERVVTGALTGLAAILAILALWTLVPEGDNKTNGLGYRSHCPFAPSSTLMLGIPAAFLWHAASQRRSIDPEDL